MENQHPRPRMGAAPKHRRGRGPGRAWVEPPQPPPQPGQSLLPHFPNTVITDDWTIHDGVVGSVHSQKGDSCTEVVLCRLLQAIHNYRRDKASHAFFSINQLSDHLFSRCKKVPITNLNIALQYICETGLLKILHEGRQKQPSPQGTRVRGLFNVEKDFPTARVLAQITQFPLAIIIEDTKILKKLGPEGIYEVPLHRLDFDADDHTLLIVAKGRCTITNREFVVVQNSYGVMWGNQGYALLFLDEAGKFSVFWPVEVITKKG